MSASETSHSRTVATPASATSLAGPWRNRVALICAIVATLALLVLSLFVGVYDITGGERGWDIFLITRVPRTLALVLSGSAMAMCGLIMQLLTQNKFVEPSTTGTTEWASLGLITVMILFPTAGLVPRMIGAIMFALIGTLVFFAFLERVSLKSSLIVPIVGIMLGAVVGSLTTFIALETDTLQSLGIWFTGSFTGLVRGRYELLFLVLLVLVAAFIVADRFTVAGLGKDVATNVGLNYRAVVFLGVFLVAVATGIVTVIVGRLPFLGLIVPNMVSMIRGDDLRSNLPWVMLLGVWVVTVCDLIARTIIAPFEMPVSVVLGIIGAAVFLVLIVRRNRRGR
ncbi:iron chelate uptake ABC transporter family permease subunit [Dermabacter hominis]|uniref:Iron ABC transporter permease n=1 Tax=Dermabacter hominis 1368 TaxID=1450519 RepID=A0ABR4SLA2_9MICO|nr:iron ABC transporter permease [Dermabacter hominis 1368]MDK8803249.1 iron chelate uptake ABC transporter family permease subunit [Dermabacter hominis]WIK60518.1 iron chelate uptake ABC transporter family permease subunit [Dermabacter hominis]